MEQWTSGCVLNVKANLAEGPVWLDDRRLLLWVDIESSLVCMFDPTTSKNQTWKLPSHVGCVAPTTKGDFLAATQQGFVRFDPDTGDVRSIVDPEADIPRNRFNDGKCDPQGRFWAGTISYDRTPEAASLYRLDSELSVHKMLSHVSTSNGLTWSLDGKTFYYIDTPTRRVDAFDFESETGEINNRRTILRVPEDIGKPDGMTIDSEGMLWIALWGGWAVTRWDPHMGQMIGKVQVPVERVSSCCFGGDGYDTLFITTARTGLSTEAVEKQPLAGGIFAAQTGHRGFPCYRFAG
jgi:sugar lactone lactonase YvrE